jgi:hypothetical protein
MAGLRHDAKVCRDHAKSELIRHSLGILTPEEQADKDRRDEEKRIAAAKLATKGNALFPE